MLKIQFIFFNIGTEESEYTFLFRKHHIAI